MKFFDIRKQFFILAGTSLILLSLLVVGGVFSRERSIQYPEGVFIGEQLYTLEYARTEKEQARGLGEREQLCETCAMAFPFAVPGKYAFWMKGMRFPLDIAWISQENRVVHIERSVAPDSKEVYVPEEGASIVLEFNAGVLDAITVGDTLTFFSPLSKKP